ncbi:MAG: hypothetical protein JWM46_145 [Candidatus Kaiserbacteria bacterium]|nr:hypothetical protein [Candidatus Kaiserbacteria bacterium]
MADEVTKLSDHRGKPMRRAVDGPAEVVGIFDPQPNAGATVSSSHIAKAQLPNYPTHSVGRKQADPDPEKPCLTPDERAHVERVRTSISSLLVIVQQHQLQVEGLQASCAIPQYSCLAGASEPYKEFCNNVDGTFSQAQSSLKRINSSLTALIDDIQEVLN